jgi:hypothetical protein
MNDLEEEVLAGYPEETLQRTKIYLQPAPSKLLGLLIYR